MAWCEAEQNEVDSCSAWRLQKIIGKQMHKARRLHAETGKAARVFTEFDYTTRKSWARGRRVVAKAEYLDKGENPRFVVTRSAPISGQPASCTRSSTVSAARWKTASRNKCACSTIACRPKR